MRTIYLTLLLLFLSLNANAVSILELSPEQTRFVSMRADKVNARSGPNIKYPIEWIYQQQNYPVEIIAEYEQWRKVRDVEGSVSWIRKNLLINSRYALVNELGEHNVYEKDNTSSKIIARVENGVIAKIKKCNKVFCYLEFNDSQAGWVDRSVLYGIKKNEEI